MRMSVKGQFHCSVRGKEHNHSTLHVGKWDICQFASVRAAWLLSKLVRLTGACFQSLLLRHWVSQWLQHICKHFCLQSPVFFLVSQGCEFRNDDPNLLCRYVHVLALGKEGDFLRQSAFAFSSPESSIYSLSASDRQMLNPCMLWCFGQTSKEFMRYLLSLDIS